MPCFKWVGITADKVSKHGYRIAKNEPALAEALATEEIALTYALVYTRLRPFSRTEKISFCHSLQHLLASGIRLKEALALTSHTLTNPLFGAMVTESISQLEFGRLLHQTLGEYGELFDPAMIALIKAGEASGSLAASLALCVTYLESQQQFIQKTRQALTVPFITLLLFVVITALLFMFFIPRFELLFESFGKPVSWSTNVLFIISHVCTAWRIALGGIIVLLGVLIGGRYSSQDQWRTYLNSVLLKVPFARSLIWHYELTYFFETLGILLSKNISLITALDLALESVHNQTIRETLAGIRDRIATGTTIAGAFRHLPLTLPAIITMIELGEHTGTLDIMIQKAGSFAANQLDLHLKKIHLWLPIGILFVLAFLVGSLVITIYLPLMTLSHAL